MNSFHLRQIRSTSILIMGNIISVIISIKSRLPALIMRVCISRVVYLLSSITRKDILMFPNPHHSHKESLPSCVERLFLPLIKSWKFFSQIHLLGKFISYKESSVEFEAFHFHRVSNFLAIDYGKVTLRKIKQREIKAKPFIIRSISNWKVKPLPVVESSASSPSIESVEIPREK